VLVLLIAAAIGCATPGSEPLLFVVDGDGTIRIVPSEIEISGPTGVPATIPYSIEGTTPSTQLASMRWLNDPAIAFASLDPACVSSPATCVFAPAPALLETGTLGCTPNAAMVRSGILKMTSNTGAIGTAFVTCKVAAASASFTVPASVGRIAAPVEDGGGGVPAALVVTNNGGEPLMITVALGATNATHWRALECTTTACPLPVGQTLSIDLSFEPTEHGELDASIEVLGAPAVGSQTVALLGTGVGGKLRVDQPAAPAFTIDFGTIAKNQPVTLPVKMSNVGNALLAITPGAPGPPFTVATTPVSIDDGQQGQFDVTCMSGVAMPQQLETITLTTDAYAQNTPAVEVRCAIANTFVQVTNPLAFGEGRVGDPPLVLEVVVANPSGMAVTIERIALVGQAPALTLTTPTLPATVAGGAQLVATLELATLEDVVLDGISLEVEVTETATVTLSQPVSGRVGTPNAIVLPLQLDLGSVCVGTPVDGSFAMSNIGTATLTLQRPTMSSPSFVPEYTNPTDYPKTGAPLLPGDKASVGVRLASDMQGPQEGTLVWDVDAPNAPFETKVAVELLMDGTAVSPGTLRYGTIDIASPPTMTQLITLENCGPGTALVGYDRVISTEGDTGAWQLDPPSQQRELLPDETMRVRVAFDPERPGIHRAELPFAIDNGEARVTLEGEAAGALPDDTSFYACGCSGSSDPTRGWPILLAIPFALRRRRLTC